MARSALRCARLATRSTDHLPRLIERLPVRQRPEDTWNHRWVLEDEHSGAIIAADFDGDPKRWVVTAYELKMPRGL